MAGAALVAAAAHVPVTGPHLHEAPYMGWLFIALEAHCLMMAVAVLMWDTPLIYTAATTVCALAIAGYAATRLIAFRLLRDDVGNWLEPMGVLSLCSEALVVGAALTVLVRAPSRSK